MQRMAGAAVKTRSGRIRMRLFLMARVRRTTGTADFVALSALSVVSRVQVEDDRIRSDYLQRARVLNNSVRISIFRALISGTFFSRAKMASRSLPQRFLPNQKTN